MAPWIPSSSVCRLKASSDSDIQLPIVEDPEGTEFESVVAEPIPQHPVPGVSLATLKQLQRDGTKVLVQGQPMLDNAHVANDDADNPISSEPKRFTLWDIHPVTTADARFGLPRQARCAP